MWNSAERTDGLVHQEKTILQIQHHEEMLQEECPSARTPIVPIDRLIESSGGISVCSMKYYEL